MDGRRRLIELGVALAVALLGGLLGRGVVGSWLAVAGGLAAFAFAVQLLAPRARALLARAERRAPRLVHAAPGAAVVFAALVPFRGLLVGEVPLGHDHPVHLARAWHFVHESIGRGRLHGFSELWFAGWPAGYDYPIGGDLWVSTFYLATFGAFGWTLTYGIAVAAMYAVVVHAHYTFGRVYLGRAAGVLVGALALLDRGAGNEGGWSYTIDWGVWPFALGMAFVLYTLSLLDGVAREGGARRIGWAALPAAFSVLCHPFAIVAYGVAVPLFSFARGAQPPTSSERWAGVAARCAAVVGLGVGLSAAWLFPFVASGEWFLRFGDLHVPVEEVARRLLRGELYGWAPLISVLAIVGAVRSFRRGIPVGVFCAGLALLALVASSRTFVEALDLGAYSSSLMRIPFQRMAYLVKPAAFVLVAIALFSGRRGRVGASAPTSAPSSAPSETTPATTSERSSEAQHGAGSTAPAAPHTTWWPTRYVVLAALALSPLVLPLVSEARAYLPNFAVATDVALEGELRAFGAWLDARRAEDPDFYRVAYVDGSEDHDLKAAIAFTGRPALHSGFTPATTYRHRYDRVDPALYRVLGVRYVVARSPLTEPWAEPLERFGRLHVHGLRAPRTERVTLEGEGRVEVLRFEPEGAGVELRVSGAAPGDRLVLHVGSFSGWRAWRDGAPLEVESRRPPVAGAGGEVG